jgi:hypothetical protein
MHSELVPEPEEVIPPPPTLALVTADDPPPVPDIIRIDITGNGPQIGRTMAAARIAMILNHALSPDITVVYTRMGFDADHLAMAKEDVDYGLNANDRGLRIEIVDVDRITTSFENDPLIGVIKENSERVKYYRRFVFTRVPDLDRPPGHCVMAETIELIK